MSDRLEVLSRVVIRKYGIRRIAFMRSGDVARASNVCLMAQLSSSLCDEEIVPSVSLVDVRSLGVRRVGSVPDTDGLRHLASIEVDLLKNDAYGIEIDGAIVVPEELLF